MLVLRLPSKVLTQRNCGVCAVGDVLLGLGCDTGQGYHFSRPVPAADLGRVLAPGHAVLD